MTTVIAAYDSDGCTGRCDAKCHDATGPDCNCICGGKNHGVGVDKAVENAREQYKEWIDEYQKAHPEVTHFEIPDDIRQLAFPF